MSTSSAYFGGSIRGGAIGGYLSMENYGNGVFSEEKAKLIRNIAHDLHSILHVPTSKLDNMKIEDVVAALKKVTPNPRKDKIVGDRDKQAVLCRKIAEVFNNRFKRNVVDTDAPAGEICNSVGEAMSTLFTGLKTEFLNVSSDIKRNLNNMTVLRNTIEDAYNRMYNLLISSDASGSTKAESEGLSRVFEKVISEQDRQINMLANLLNTTVDETTKTIADLDEDNVEFRGFVRELKSDLGSPGMSKKLVNLLAGVNNVASAARVVDKALKQIGASVQQYKSIPEGNTNRLIDHLRQVWESKHTDPSRDEVDRLVTALEVIRNNDYAHSDIADYLSKRGGALGGASGGVYNPNKVEDENPRSLSSQIKKQGKVRDVLFREFERSLETSYRTILSNVEILAKRMGSSIPLNDHLQDFVRAFNTLKDYGEFEKEKFYLALSGYKTDASSKEERQRFLGRLQHVSKTLRPLAAGPAGEYFNAIKHSVDHVIELVENWSDKYLKPLTKMPGLKYATTSMSTNGSGVEGGDPDDDTGDDHDADDDHRDSSIPASTDDSDALSDSASLDIAPAVPDSPPAVDSDSDPSNIDLTGDDLVDEYLIAAHNKDVGGGARRRRRKHRSTPRGGAAGTYVTLTQAINHLNFFYKVTKVRENLNIAAKDMKGYGKDYEAILGDSIGEMVVRLKRDHDAVERAITEETNASGVVPIFKRFVDGTPNDIITFEQWTGVSFGQGADGVAKYKAWRESVKDDVLKLLKEQLDVKIDFLKTVETIDLYLMHFADAIASNPSDIKELSAQLKGVDIVAKWFTDRSGNTIAELYESFPSFLAEVPAGATFGQVTNEYNNDQTAMDALHNDAHYYEWVGGLVHGVQQRASVHLPGNPFLGRLPGKLNADDEKSVVETILDRAQKAAASVRVLDNIVSTFIRLGDQFGDASLKTKAAMSPGVIFKNLRRYMYHSALVMGWRTGTEDRGGVKTYSTTGHSDDVLQFKTNLPVAATGVASASVNHKPGPVQVGVYGSAGGVVPTTTGAAAANTAGDFHRYMRGNHSIAMSSIYDTNGNSLSGFNNTWYNTDTLWIMVIKSMVSKVFTVIGSYGVFNKPLDRYSSISTTRMILGGSADTPEIIPAATELYIRLPLLAEFYRETFKFEESTDPNDPNYNSENKKISMVPEMDGIWDAFVRIIFDDARYIKEGTYNENHIRAIITEINNVYRRLRPSNEQMGVTSVVAHFVAEINRRYGIVKKDDVKAYIKDKRRYERGADYTDRGESLDYNILDEAGASGRRPLASDKFDHVSKLDTEYSSTNIFTPQMVSLVRKFRDNMDTQIRKMSTNYPGSSFEDSIMGYKQQIERARDNEERYKIILKSMQGFDQLNTLNQQKALMFHELVVSPLSTLHVIWSIVNEFTRRVNSMNLQQIERTISDALTRDPGQSNYNTVTSKLRSAHRHEHERYIHVGYHADRRAGQNDASTFNTWTRNYGAAGAATNVLVYQGVYGAHANITWAVLEQISARSRGDTDRDKRNRDGFTRFAVDRDLLFKDMVGLVSSFGSDLGELVSIKVQQKSLIVEYGALAELCVGMLNDVKKNIENFRGIIDESIISAVEGGVQDPNSNSNRRNQAGSIYWLEDNLIESIFRDSRENNADYGIGLTRVNEILSYNFKKFADEWKVTAKITGGANPDFEEFPSAAPTGATDLDRKLYALQREWLRDSIEKPLAELVYWNPHIEIAPNGPASWTAVGTSARRHPLLSKDNVNNVGSTDWPFNVIPGTGSPNQDEDLKRIEGLRKTLVDLKQRINARIDTDPALFTTSSTDPTAQPRFPGTSIAIPVQSNARYAAAYGNVSQAARFLSPVFVVPSAPGQPAVNNPAPHDTERDNIGFAATVDNWPGMPQDVRTMVQQYQAAWLEHEKLLKGTFSGPVSSRIRWYEEVTGADGYWFLNQLQNGDNDGTSELEAGLIVRLNQILNRYLYTNWDNTSAKIPVGLVSKFASGTHSTATMQGIAINDITRQWTQISNPTAPSANARFAGVPSQHSVIFASLARALRNIMVRKAPKASDLLNAFQNMSDVPIHIKETMRASLPSFEKLFKLLIKKAEFLRQLSQHLSTVRFLGIANSYGYNDPNQRIDATKISAGDVVHSETGIPFRAIGQIPPNTVGNFVAGTGNATEFTAWVTKTIGADAQTPETNLYVRFDPYVFLGEKDAKQWFTGVLDDIVGAATSLSKCASETYKEIGDDPKFLETHEGSIVDYVNNNKRQPIMVLSQIQEGIRNRFRQEDTRAINDAENDNGSGWAYPNFMLPLYTSGHTAFKLQYGIRHIINRSDAKPSLDYMPGMYSLLERYNGVASGDTRVDKDVFAKFVKNHATALRYIIDLKHFRSILDVGTGGRYWTQYVPGGQVTVQGAPTVAVPAWYAPHPQAALYDTVIQTAAVTGTDPQYRYKKTALPWAERLRAYPMRIPLDTTISITESSNQEDTLNDFIDSLKATTTNAITNRESARIMNIIDLNIVPINVHALMREIPLVNLINYSYTCDRIIQDTLYPDAQLRENNTSIILESDQVTSTKALMCKMLLYPYAPLSNTEYYGYLGRIVTGDSGLDLGRPKFLGDQLWNKALLNELYQLPRVINDRGQRPDEAGPRVDTSQRRALQHYTPAKTWELAQNLGVDQLVGLYLSNIDAGVTTATVTAALTAVIRDLRARGMVIDPAVATSPTLIGVASELSTAILPEARRIVNAAITQASWQNSNDNQSAVAANLPGNVATQPRIIEFVDLATRRAAVRIPNRAQPILTRKQLVTAVVAAIFHTLLTEEAKRDNSELTGYENNATLQYASRQPTSNNGAVTLTSVAIDTTAALNTTAYDIRSDLATIGRLRFDTTFARNTFFLVNLQRVMRMIMRDEVTYLESPVVNSASVLDRQITEYESNEVYNRNLFHQ